MTIVNSNLFTNCWVFASHEKGAIVRLNFIQRAAGFILKHYFYPVSMTRILLFFNY